MKVRKLLTSPRRSFVAVVFLVLLTAVGNLWYWQVKSAEVDTHNRETAELVARADAQIAEAQSKRAAQKAQQEADAKTMADTAASGIDPNDSTVDSRVCNRATAHADPSNIAVVVNKKHCIQPVGYTPDDLVTINGATISTKVADAFSRLYAAAAAAHQPFYVTSSFRSYQNQATTYAYWVSTSGREGADTYSARPGYSEHQTGFAFDVATIGCVLDCFGSTSQYTWLQQNAADYGFIQRYYSGYEAITGYKAEEWHYRYVGVEVAKDMKTKGVKTLEQYWNVSGGDY